MKLTPSLMLALTSAFVLFTAGGAHAATLYSTGFEAPTFSLGPLNIQGGWGELAGPSSVANVESTNVKTGSQALNVIPALAGTTVNQEDQDGAFYAMSASAPVIVQSADIYLYSSSNQSAWQFAATGPSFGGFIGGIDVNPDNTVSLITSGYPTASVSFQRNQWNHVALTMDFATQTWSFALNGSTVASNVSFCGDNGGCGGAPVASYGDGLFDTFPALDGSGNNIANDLGLMDNYSVAAVPEPALWLSFSTGLALLAWRRRKASIKPLAQ